MPPENLLVRDYDPQSMLVLEEHVPAKPCCPVINVHTHTSMKIAKPQDLADHMMQVFVAALGGDNPTTRDFRHTMAAVSTPIEDVVRVMDECDIEQYVDLDGVLSTPEHLQLYQGFRDRFLLFHVLSLAGWEAPDYGLKRANELAEAVEQGARGLKVHKTLGLTARDAAGRIVPIDDPRFDRIWSQAGELGVPVLIHCGDPAPYFTPVDRHNRCYQKLVAHPERSYYGQDYATKQQILEQRNHIIARHRKTTFIGAHHGNQAEDLASVGDLLDRYSNFYVDCSYALVPLGLTPHTCRKHFIRYQDRILFGTDGLPEPARYGMYYRWLETDDDYFECGNGAWSDHICGLKLPKKVLAKIYRQNARRIIPPN